MKDEQPKFRHQIVAIAGDCCQPNLGMSLQDRAILIREVTIVFHVAATVRFDEKMKLAVATNVRSSKDVLNLCKEIPNLKVFRCARENDKKSFFSSYFSSKSIFHSVEFAKKSRNLFLSDSRV